jgi:hypothetical protein
MAMPIHPQRPAISPTALLASRPTASPLAIALLLGLLTAGLMFVLHPRLNIGDVDAYAYIMGAHSIRQGHGYRSLSGEPFNHWPPGYSALLSPFPDPLAAARVINYVSAGVAVGLLYCLLWWSGWSWQAGAGFCLAIASGFFRLLAELAHPDILTYALFLTAVVIATRQNQRLFPSLIWGILIPVKLIAAAFLPAAMGADLVSGSRWERFVRRYLPGVALSAAGLAAILLFNRFTIGQWIPASHERPSWRAFVSGLRHFLVSLPREFLFSWHGTIARPFPILAFALCMLLAALCILSLRPAPEHRWLRVYAAFFFPACAALLCVRSYDPTVRLLGYGVIVLFLGYRPKLWANAIWLLYGLLSLAVGIVNASTVNSLGANDPRYAALAARVRPYVAGAEVVATNSFHLLDLHANIPSVPVNSEAEAAAYDRYLWVTLDNFDPGASTISPAPHPGSQWCEQQRVEGAVLFKRCKPL